MSNVMCPIKVRQGFSKIMEYKQNSTGENEGVLVLNVLCFCCRLEKNQ